MATKNPTLGDYPSTDEPEDCPHEMRTLDEDPFTCFECWMAEKEGTSFMMERDH